MGGAFDQAVSTGISDTWSSAQIAPDRSLPRSLSSSQFGLVYSSDGNLVYDSPNETNQYLYKSQGTANPNFRGTCGLCSCANILRLSGVNATEEQMITYSSNTDNPINNAKKLCSTGYPNSGMNGGTSPYTRQLILNHFGVKSDVVDMSFDNDGRLSYDNLVAISDYVCAGKGVILSVHAKVLWYDAPVGMNDFHAVTVTSVKKDTNGNILGFYICDSAKNGTAYYSAAHLQRALTGSPMNVTRSIIR